TVTLASAGRAVFLDRLPTGPVGTLYRRIYRTNVDSDTYHLVATLDNVVTSYVDRENLVGTDPLTVAAGAAFSAALTPTDTGAANNGTGSAVVSAGELQNGTDV